MSPETFYSLTLREWAYAVRAHSPSHQVKMEHLLGEMVLAYSNVHRKKGARRITVYDLMPWIKKPTPKTMSEALLTAFKGLGAKRVNGPKNSKPNN